MTQEEMFKLVKGRFMEILELTEKNYKKFQNWYELLQNDLYYRTDGFDLLSLMRIGERFYRVRTAYMGVAISKHVKDVRETIATLGVEEVRMVMSVSDL